MLGRPVPGGLQRQALDARRGRRRSQRLPRNSVALALRAAASPGPRGACLGASGLVYDNLSPTRASGGTRGDLAEHFRRIDPRYDRQLEVEMLFDGKKQITRTRNLSLGGLYVETPFPIAIGTT